MEDSHLPTPWLISLTLENTSPPNHQYLISMALLPPPSQQPWEGGGVEEPLEQLMDPEGQTWRLQDKN